MRIVLDYRMRSGGVARYARSLATGLRQLEDVSVAIAGTELGPPFSPPARSRVGRFAQEQKAEVLHGTHFELPPRGDAAQVVTIPDLIPLEHPASMPSAGRRMLFRRLVLTSLRRAEAIIVPSPSTADSLKSMGCDPALVSVVPHGVSGNFRPVSPPKRAMARGRFASGRPYFAAVLSSKAHKNQQELL
ncbi:MAG: glycosyltransferase, partial [Actinomycetota bacterium]